MAAAFQRPTGLSCILRSQQVTHAWHVRKRTRGMSWKDPLPWTQRHAHGQVWVGAESCNVYQPQFSLFFE